MLSTIILSSRRAVTPPSRTSWMQASAPPHISLITLTVSSSKAFKGSPMKRLTCDWAQSLDSSVASTVETFTLRHIRATYLHVCSTRQWSRKKQKNLCFRSSRWSWASTLSTKWRKCSKTWSSRKRCTLNLIKIRTTESMASNCQQSKC